MKWKWQMASSFYASKKNVAAFTFRRVEARSHLPFPFHRIHHGMCTILQCITSHKHRSMILERRDPSSGFDDAASEIKRRAFAHAHPPGAHAHPSPHELHAIASLGVQKRSESSLVRSLASGLARACDAESSRPSGNALPVTVVGTPPLGEMIGVSYVVYETCGLHMGTQ